MLASGGLIEGQDLPGAMGEPDGESACNAFQFVAIGDGCVAAVLPRGVDAVAGFGVDEAVEVGGVRSWLRAFLLSWEKEVG